MAEIIKGTTPTIRFIFESVNVSNIEKAVLTIKQDTVAIQRDITTATVSTQNKSLSWKLTQSETLDLTGMAKVMVNWLLADGTRGASEEMAVEFTKNHVEEVIE